MPIVVAGLNHRTAPVSLLERLAIADEDLPKALHQLSNFEHTLEAAVLSTCNRVEVYANVTKFHGGIQDLRNFLAEFRHVAPEDFTDDLYTYHDEAAVSHLFRVAAGIDSMVVGESEILGQVRRAYQVAQGEGSVSRVLGRAFRQALHVGKRARSETAIGRNPVSVSSAAVDLARRAFPGESLSGKRVAIVGAGKMGRLAVHALRRAGVADLTVVNRTEERAKDLARAYGVTPLPFDRLEETLAAVDIALFSTTSPSTIVDRDLMESALGRRQRRPLFIVDIAVPRDVDPIVGELPGLLLRDIDDLRGVVEFSIGSRLGEVAKVEEIVSEEQERFAQWERATEVAPTIADLVERSEAIRTAELAHVEAALSSLEPEERAAVERLTKRISSKLMHDPLSRTKELASSKQGHVYLAALRELFGLDDEGES
jgi:glutamyl-tRNA reductase